jgi:hypothetical protein
MMANHIVFNRPDGGVSIIIPASDVPIATVLARSVPEDATDVTVVDEITLPTDRTYRNAWEQVAGKITVAMPKARVIHSGRIAQAIIDESARLGLLPAGLRLQGKTKEADQAVDDKAAVDELDLTALATQMAKASNPTTLHAIWPSVLSR